LRTDYVRRSKGSLTINFVTSVDLQAAVTPEKNPSMGNSWSNRGTTCKIFSSSTETTSSSESKVKWIKRLEIVDETDLEHVELSACHLSISLTWSCLLE